jgi:hypothetical protein
MVNRPIENSRAFESGAAKKGRVNRPVLFLLFGAIFGAAAAWPGCSFTEVNKEEAAVDPVVLIDQTGKEWDITTAVHKYGFEVDRFEFGLGPRAIRPLIEPDMLSPGDFGYPAEDAPFLVIGAAIEGDIRAYGKLDLTVNEVVDEFIGGAPVAVAY